MDGGYCLWAQKTVIRWNNFIYRGPPCRWWRAHQKKWNTTLKMIQLLCEDSHSTFNPLLELVSCMSNILNSQSSNNWLVLCRKFMGMNEPVFQTWDSFPNLSTELKTNSTHQLTTPKKPKIHHLSSEYSPSPSPNITIQQAIGQNWLYDL